MPPRAGPQAQQPTAHSHSHSLSTAMATAPAFALLLLLLLLGALLIIALLLVPENTQRLSVEQREAWCGELTYRVSTSWRYTWVLPPAS